MNPTGRLEDDGRTLLLTRTFPAPAEVVWASVTESERLGRWFATWTGDPTDGYVMVSMNAEAEPVPPARFDITVCEPPRRLSVESTDGNGTWKVTVELSETDGVTTLVFRQDDLDPSAAPDVGPGWEWYLDRLVAAEAGGPVPDLDAFDRDYMPLSAAYAAMGPTARPST